jgi:tetratricopeptide (TPR) repeat protein
MPAPKILPSVLSNLRVWPLSALCSLGLIGLYGCSGDGEPADLQGAGVDLPITLSDRSQDPRVLSLRQALADGWDDVAAELYEDLKDLPELGVESQLLGARLAAMVGDPIESSRLLERAKLQEPKDARVWATAAELAMEAGRGDTALEEWKKGRKLCGLTPEMLRAEGVLAIFQTGMRQGRRGVALLEKAVQLDPGLPFVNWPLSEAHRLLAQEVAGTQPELAIEHCEKAVSLTADNLEAREFLGDLYMTAGRWGEGIKIFESLMAEGRPLDSKVALFSKQAGVVALKKGHRELAVDYFDRARELGLTDEELGTGALVLREQGKRHLKVARKALDAKDLGAAWADLELADRYWPQSIEVRETCSEAFVRKGLVAFSEDRLEDALEEFETALGWDGESLMARYLQGNTYMELGRYGEAAKSWYLVVDKARLSGLKLPDPVHLSLARALALTEKEQEARQVLNEYLEFEPRGRFEAQTRKLLAVLDGQ